MGAACASGHICDSISGEVILTTGTGSIVTGQLLIAFGLTRTNKPNCDVSAFKAGTNIDNDGGVETVSSLTITAKAALANSTAYAVKYVCGGI